MTWTTSEVEAITIRHDDIDYVVSFTFFDGWPEIIEVREQGEHERINPSKSMLDTFYNVLKPTVN